MNGDKYKKRKIDGETVTTICGDWVAVDASSGKTFFDLAYIKNYSGIIPCEFLEQLVNDVMHCKKNDLVVKCAYIVHKDNKWKALTLKCLGDSLFKCVGYEFDSRRLVPFDIDLHTVETLKENEWQFEIYHEFSSSEEKRWSKKLRNGHCRIIPCMALKDPFFLVEETMRYERGFWIIALPF